jgi:hypothetical protein
MGFGMRARFLALLLALPATSTLTAAARADHAPAYVVPGRPDVPVMINGVDASWGVVEGDYGLYRPGAVPVTVIPSPLVAPLPPVSARHYFPSLGGIPAAGRLEVEPPENRRLPPPAPSFHREWSSQSGGGPVTEYAPSPPMIIAPTPRVSPFFPKSR